MRNGVSLGEASLKGAAFGRWELMTNAAGAAAEFYQRVFAWEAAREELADEVIYTHLKTRGGMVIGGLYPMAGELATRPVAPHWTPFIVVEEVDTALAKAKALGGFATTETFAFAGRGHMALVQDPTGAPLGLWQERGAAAAADFAWHELSTSDAAAAAAFYHALCGWHLSQDAHGPINYRLFTSESRLMAAMLALGPRYQTVPSHWLPYFRVASVEAAEREIKAAGGKILAPATIGGLGTQAVAQDPQGAVFGLMAPVAELQ